MRISRETMYLWDIAAVEEPVSQCIPERDYCGLNKQNSQLRIWLPDSAKVALAEVVKRRRTSLTAYLTEYLATYLYGYHELLIMQDRRIGLYEPIEVSPYSKSCAEAVPDYVKSLGKNLFAIKIFVSGRLKDDLESRAKQLNITLGELTRGLICHHLFGQEYGDLGINFKSLEFKNACEWENSELDD